METFTIVYITRMALYFIAGYIAFSKRIWWLGATAVIAGIIGTVSFATQDEVLVGIVSNLLGLMLVITALDAKRR